MIFKKRMVLVSAHSLLKEKNVNYRLVPKIVVKMVYALNQDVNVKQDGQETTVLLRSVPMIVDRMENV